jgi:hypothetical protein
MHRRDVINIIAERRWFSRRELITMTSRMMIIIKTTNLICCRKISFPVSIELIIAAQRLGRNRNNKPAAMVKFYSSQGVERNDKKW